MARSAKFRQRLRKSDQREETNGFSSYLEASGDLILLPAFTVWYLDLTTMPEPRCVAFSWDVPEGQNFVPKAGRARRWRHRKCRLPVSTVTGVQRLAIAPVRITRSD